MFFFALQVLPMLRNLIGCIFFQALLFTRIVLGKTAVWPGADAKLPPLSDLNLDDIAVEDVGEDSHTKAT